MLEQVCYMAGHLYGMAVTICWITLFCALPMLLVFKMGKRALRAKKA